ncbi:hypothetical protein DRJ22_06395, partial [Candidatus Woesearchaeota archaeon]
MFRKIAIAIFIIVIIPQVWGTMFPKIPVTETFGSSGCGACRAFDEGMRAVYPPYIDSVSVVINISGITPGDAYSRKNYYYNFYSMGGIPWTAVDGSDADHYIAGSVMNRAVNIFHTQPLSPIGFDLLYYDHDSIVVQIYTDSASYAGQWSLVALVERDSIDLGDGLIANWVCKGIITPDTGEIIDIEAGVPFRWSGTNPVPYDEETSLYNMVFFLQEPGGTLIANSYHTSMRPRLRYDFEAKQNQKRYLVPTGEIIEANITLVNWGLEDDTYRTHLEWDAPAGWEFFYDFPTEPISQDIFLPAFADTVFKISLVAPSVGVANIRFIAYSDSIPDRADTLLFQVNSGGEYLLVCDSPTPEDSSLYKDAMDGLGIDYIYWDTQRDGALNYVDEIGLRRIIWFCGEDTVDNILGDERQALENFLVDGGELLLTGSGIGRVNSSAFLFFRDALGTHYDGIADDFASAVALPLYPFIGFYGNIEGISTAEKFSGEEAYDGYTILRYPDGSAAGTAKANESNSIIIGFPIERLAGHGFADIFQRCWEFLNIGWSSIANDKIPQNLIVSAHPNPFNSICEISIFSPSAGDLNIYDISGHTVAQFPIASGQNRIKWRADGMNSG